MTLASLRVEFEGVVVGPAILAEVERAVDLITPRYDPVIYGRARQWADAQDDLVQDVVTTVLIEEGQLKYLFDTARTLDDFRALLYRQVRRLLARRRQRTIIDNLLERVRDVLSAHHFEQLAGTPARFKVAGRELEDRSPTPDELHSVARRVAAIPRVPFNAGERAPIVYSPKALRTAVGVIGDALPTPLSIRDVDAILRLVLTDWIPSFLEEGEESLAARDEELTPEEMVVVEDTVTRILTTLTNEQCLILLRKIEGESDAALAVEIGVSRPTLAGRKDAVFKVLETELEDMAEGLQRGVTGELALRLARVDVS